MQPELEQAHVFLQWISENAFLSCRLKDRKVAQQQKRTSGDDHRRAMKKRKFLHKENKTPGKTGLHSQHCFANGSQVLIRSTVISRHQTETK